MLPKKKKKQDFPRRKEGLDLVEEEDQITHYELELDQEGLVGEEVLDVFKFDPNYLENEEKYAEIKCVVTVLL